MSFSNKLLTLAAPALLLTASACSTGFPAQVSRFSALPAPQGQSFVIQAADPENRGGLEFSQYASRVRQHLIAQGYSEASSADSATLLVSLDYGVDDGRQQIVTYPASRFGGGFGGGGFGGGRFGYGGYGGFGYGRGFYRPYYSRFGYYGSYRSPFYYGWDDPFWFGSEVDSYTLYTSYLDLDIKRRADGQSLFEGTAKARSRTDQLQVLVPNLVEAMFTGFPGNSGETVRITVPDRERS